MYYKLNNFIAITKLIRIDLSAIESILLGKTETKTLKYHTYYTIFHN